MPKLTNTRQQRAERLLQLLEEGPTSLADDELRHTAFAAGLTTTDIEDRVKIHVLAKKLQEAYESWFKTWIKYETIDLIRELRVLAKYANRYQQPKK